MSLPRTDVDLATKAAAREVTAAIAELLWDPDVAQATQS